MRGADRNENYDYPDDEWIYYLCAKEFGWTITETDNQPAGTVSWLLGINGIVKEIENDNNQS
ncbi:MAG: hypothetical protein EBS18_02815 [Actinobacteria bacterium]|nr:hypothetical protein [Actinomycetota bacterium]